MHARTILNITAVPCGILILLCILLPLGYYAIILRRTMHPEAINYHTLNINTETLTAEFADPIPGLYPPREDYYTYFRGATGLGIYHYDGTRNLAYPVRYNAFDAEHDTRLLNREKLQRVVERSLWYRVCTNEILLPRFFGRSQEGEPARCHAVCQQCGARAGASHRPSAAGAARLSAISLVRVLRTHPEYGVVTAVYDRHGDLQRAGFFGSKGGDSFQQPDMEIAREHDELSTKQPAAEERYGIPHRFPIADYLKLHQLVWKDTGKPNPSNIINLHYDYNRWVRQDMFDASGKRTTRYLTYVLTPEDKTLEPIDWAIPFGQYERK